MKHALALTVLAGILVAGCATSGGGMSDEEQVQQMLNDWVKALNSKDIDVMMALYSDDFAHDGYDYAAEGKDELKEFILYSMDEGYMDNVEVILDDADIVIENGKASVYPIPYTNDQGSVTVGLEAVKEGKNWLIVDMDIEGL